MSDYGWNMRHGNMHVLNLGRRQRPYNPTQNIACRICNHVFVSTRALINHIESHMVEDSAATSRMAALQHIITNRLPSQTNNLFVNSFVPNYFANADFPIPSRGTRPFFIDRLRPRPLVQLSAPTGQGIRYMMINNRIVAARPFRRGPQFQVSPMARNFDGYSLAPVRFVPPTAVAALQAQMMTNATEEPRSDPTRPYLNQLDHPVMAMVDAIEIKEDNNNAISGSNELDLDLKL